MRVRGGEAERKRGRQEERQRRREAERERVCVNKMYKRSISSKFRGGARRKDTYRLTYSIYCTQSLDSFGIWDWCACLVWTAESITRLPYDYGTPASTSPRHSFKDVENYSPGPYLDPKEPTFLGSRYIISI